MEKENNSPKSKRKSIGRRVSFASTAHVRMFTTKHSPSPTHPQSTLTSFNETLKSPVQPNNLINSTPTRQATRQATKQHTPQKSLKFTPLKNSAKSPMKTTPTPVTRTHSHILNSPVAVTPIRIIKANQSFEASPMDMTECLTRKISFGRQSSRRQSIAMNESMDETDCSGSIEIELNDNPPIQSNSDDSIVVFNEDTIEFCNEERRIQDETQNLIEITFSNDSIELQPIADVKMTVQEFFSLTNITFNTNIQPTLRKSLVNESIHKQFSDYKQTIYDSCITQHLCDMYTFGIQELQNSYNSTNSNVKKLVLDIESNNPSIFKDFYFGSEDLRSFIIDQLKQYKQKSRLDALVGWYEWKYGLIVSVNKSILEAVEALEAQLPEIRATNEKIDSIPAIKVEMSEMRSEIKQLEDGPTEEELDTRLAELEALIEEKERELEQRLALEAAAKEQELKDLRDISELKQIVQEQESFIESNTIYSNQDVEDQEYFHTLLKTVLCVDIKDIQPQSMTLVYDDCWEIQVPEMRINFLPHCVYSDSFLDLFLSVHCNVTEMLEWVRVWNPIREFSVELNNLRNILPVDVKCGDMLEVRISLGNKTLVACVGARHEWEAVLLSEDGGKKVLEWDGKSGELERLVGRFM